MSDRIQATIKRIPNYAEGGLASAAENVRGAGRYGDDMVVHVNKEEFDEMRAKYGEPTINPETGMPEFFLGKLFDKVKNNIIPAAIGAGLGFLTSGPTGAISGALGNIFGGDDGGGSPISISGQQGGDSGFYKQQAGTGAGQKKGGINAIGALAGLASIIGNAMTKDRKSEAAAANEAQQQVQFNTPLQPYVYDRKYIGYNPVDATAQGEQQYFAENQLAQGGQPTPGRYIEGPSDGRADNIKAELSEGEYVIDAETVALLGNGNNAAGAQRLDEMREGIRAHKGQALAQGKFSPDAAHPLQYLR